MCSWYGETLYKLIWNKGYAYKCLLGQQTWCPYAHMPSCIACFHTLSLWIVLDSLSAIEEGLSCASCAHEPGSLMHIPSISFFLVCVFLYFPLTLGLVSVPFPSLGKPTFSLFRSFLSTSNKTSFYFSLFPSNILFCEGGGQIWRTWVRSKTDFAFNCHSIAYSTRFPLDTYQNGRRRSKESSTFSCQGCCLSSHFI